MAPYYGEDIQFASAVVYNVGAYLYGRFFDEEIENKQCTYYSKYCAEVITLFLENNYGHYFRALVETCKNLTEANQLLRIGHDIFVEHYWNDPSDAAFYECCARIGVLGIVLAHHEKSFHIADLVILRNLATVNHIVLLHESYDEGRWHARCLLAAIYRWALDDLADYVSEADNKIGWVDINLPEPAFNYLEGCGVDILTFWSELRPFRVMTKNKFLAKAVHIQKIDIHAFDGTEAQRFEFACKVGLLSLHSVRHGCPEAATICVDLFTKFFLKAYMNVNSDSESESSESSTDSDSDSDTVKYRNEGEYETLEIEYEFGYGEMESVEGDFQQLKLESEVFKAESTPEAKGSESVEGKLKSVEGDFQQLKLEESTNVGADSRPEGKYSKSNEGDLESVESDFKQIKLESETTEIDTKPVTSI